MDRIYINYSEFCKLTTLQKKYYSLITDIDIPYSPNLPWGSVKYYVPNVYKQLENEDAISDVLAQAFRVSCKVIGNNDANFEPSRPYISYKKHETLNIFEDLQNNGLCSEGSWGENVSIENIGIASCEYEAKLHKLKDYHFIPADKNLIKNIEATIASGKPVIAFLNFYSSYCKPAVAKTGMIQMPEPVNWYDSNDPKDKFLGMQPVLVTSYTHTNSKMLFTACESLSEEFGNKGFIYIPYSYINHPKLGIMFCVIEANP